MLAKLFAKSSRHFAGCNLRCRSSATSILGLQRAALRLEALWVPMLYRSFRKSVDAGRQRTAQVRPFMFHPKWRAEGVRRLPLQFPYFTDALNGNGQDGSAPRMLTHSGTLDWDRGIRPVWCEDFDSSLP
jgi:hypothetical protein